MGFRFSLRSNLGNYVYNNVASSNAALSEGSINNKWLSIQPSAIRFRYEFPEHERIVRLLCTKRIFLTLR